MARFTKTLDSKTLNGDLNYFTSSGKAMCLPYYVTLTHVFTHGVHHRGQITTALTAMGYECPEIDLVYMLAENARAD